MTIKAEFGFLLEYVTDIEAARSFFENTLGIKAERYHPTFVQYNHFAIANDASMSGGRDSELYWLVENIQAVYEELSKQAEVVMPIKEMPFGKVFAIKDPAGKPQYLLEFARERPSKPV